MREIKFRAWDEIEKRMICWYDRVFTKNNNSSMLCEYPLKNISESYVKYMQYTGLNDKNGKEIYEGDIVKYLDGNEWSTESGYDCEEFNNHGAIFFDEECGRYDVTNKQGIGYDDLFDCGVDFEIIGNIYENPELVKN
ncbi:hypothetical protein C6352_26435 [Bacillus thuringiensis]|uniref:YopX family protein n=1 Tax=Bacillus thuringiensis TaxID=1428 RepID=UPI000D03F9C2|nr:YopX family protein [Bacillus thuringiensis]PRT05216.1 hypothetical protein C6352_26435 [Bacillus thuringiensis]